MDKQCKYTVMEVRRMLPEEQKRLESALLNFIEKTAEEPSKASTKEIEILPLMAHELIELWKI